MFLKKITIWKSNFIPLHHPKLIHHSTDITPPTQKPKLQTTSFTPPPPSTAHRSKPTPRRDRPPQLIQRPHPPVPTRFPTSIKRIGRLGRRGPRSLWAAIIAIAVAILRPPVHGRPVPVFNLHGWPDVRFVGHKSPSSRQIRRPHSEPFHTWWRISRVALAQPIKTRSGVNHLRTRANKSDRGPLAFYYYPAVGASAPRNDSLPSERYMHFFSVYN